jgi:coenzyme Q-binding protein COQ10
VTEVEGAGGGYPHFFRPFLAVAARPVQRRVAMQEQAGSKTAIARVPIDFFWSIITDYERYPEIVDDVRKARIVERRPGETVATFTAKVFLKSFDYTIRLVEDKHRKLTWSLVESASFTANDGGWDLEAISPNETRVHYWMSLKTNLWLPKSFVSAAANLALPSVLKRWIAFSESEWARRGGGASTTPPSTHASA